MAALRSPRAPCGTTLISREIRFNGLTTSGQPYQVPVVEWDHCRSVTGGRRLVRCAGTGAVDGCPPWSLSRAGRFICVVRRVPGGWCPPGARVVLVLGLGQLPFQSPTSGCTSLVQ